MKTQKCFQYLPSFAYCNQPLFISLLRNFFVAFNFYNFFLLLYNIYFALPLFSSVSLVMILYPRRIYLYKMHQKKNLNYQVSSLSVKRVKP